MNGRQNSPPAAIGKTHKRTLTRGFEQFRSGTFGNGGQNLYVSRQGVLQRIHHSDVNADGYADLIFCNSQNHEEKVPLHVYPNPVLTPDKRRELDFGGARDACVAKLGDSGGEDLVVARGWDGVAQRNNSVIIYGHEGKLDGRFFGYLRTKAATGVAAGDFNGNGKTDLVFSFVAPRYDKTPRLRVFYQDDAGFGMCAYKEHPDVHNDSIGAIRLRGDDPCDSLIIRKPDGAYTVIPGSPEGLKVDAEYSLLGPDKDYAPQPVDEKTELQTVREVIPQVMFVVIDGATYLCAFRREQTDLHPLLDNGTLGEPLSIRCRAAAAIAVGDIFGRGRNDLAVACSGYEGSYFYPQNEQGGYDESERIRIETSNANDALFHDFSGNGRPDLVICQSYTKTSFESEILVFPFGPGDDPATVTPIRLPSPGANRIFVVHGELVVLTVRCGSRLGNPDLQIYLGGPDGLHPDRQIRLPAWGCIDMVCCDFDDDGYPDVALSNNAEMCARLDPGSFVHYNSATGFDPERTTVLPTRRARGIACGDLNHNGYLDLVISYVGNVIDIFHGSSEGFSADRRTRLVLDEGLKSNYIALADLNGDGYLDLVANFYAPHCYILWGGPDGFSPQNKQVLNAHNTANIQVADLNNNGYPDLILCGGMPQEARPLDSFIHIYHGSNRGYAECRRSLLPSRHTHCLCVADLNNNGLLDLFAGSYQDGLGRDIDSYIYWNSGDNGFTEFNRTVLPTHAATGAKALDITGNGYLDLVVANHKVYGAHMAYSEIWYNGPQGFSEKHVDRLPTSGPHGMGNVDLGNVMDRGDAEYYVSAPQKLPKGIQTFSLDWDGELSPGTSVDIAVRCANSREALEHAHWQEGSRASPEGDWFQYRLTLKARFAAGSPRIKQVTIEYEK